MVTDMYFDPLYLLFMLPGLALSLWASFKVKSAFSHYSQVPAASGLSGAQAAAELMRRKGITDVTIEPSHGGALSDHYDPFKKALRLSPDVYNGRSLAALGVAAHEAGHAIQHATGYGPLKFRSLIVRPAQIGSNLGAILAGVGLFLHSTNMVWVGVVLFSAFVIFTLVTLPVEFNASNRAVAVLEQSGMILPSEREGTRAVLSAAAMTYVAGAISAILQLLYFLMRSGILGGRNDER
jgi:Zn-dependent membrane protease YugP